MKKYSLYSAIFALVLAFGVSFAYAADENATSTDNSATGMDEKALEKDASDAKEKVDSKSGETVKMELPAKKLIKVVQNKLYKKEMKGLLLPYFGGMPFGDYYKSMVIGLKADFFITEYMGLQLNFAYDVYAKPSEFMASALKNLSGDPKGVPAAKMEFLTNLDFVFIPLYGKFSLLSEVIAHYDLGIYLGGGVSRYKSVSSSDISYINDKYTSYGENLDPALAGDPWTKISPAIDAGVFAQIYILNWLLVRADFMFVDSLTHRRVFDVAKKTMQDSESLGIQEYMLTLGVGFMLPPN